MSDPLSLRVRSSPRVCEPDGAILKTKGQREAELANALVQFYHTRHGRGPEHARAYLMDDMVLIRQRGSLTPVQSRLALSPDGWDLVKQMHDKLAAMNRSELSELIEQILGHRVKMLYSDISRNGDRIDLLILERPWNTATD